jgi:glycosyltransferase involved in cell wall biosynthesis
MSLSILQLGPMPPPYGGISTHIAALKHRLEENNIKTEVASFQTVSALWHMLNCKIVHSHEISARSKILLPLLRGVNKRVMLSVHGDGLEDQLTTNQVLKLNPLGKLLLRKALKHYDYIIAANDKIKQFLLSVGVNEGCVVVIPEFIPVETTWDYRAERPDIESFIHGRKVFFLSGDLRKYHGAYLYGFDLMFDFVKKNREMENHICVFMNVTNGGDIDSIEELERMRVGNHLENVIYINRIPLISALPLIKESFALIRPTNTDGNSVSILEALYLKVPVIASDVVDRPKSCLLFKSRDGEDLSRAIHYLMDNYSHVKKGIKETFDSFKRIRDIYESLA